MRHFESALCMKSAIEIKLPWVDLSHDLILNLKPAKVFHSVISLGTEFQEFVALTENTDVPNSVDRCCTTQSRLLDVLVLLPLSERSDTN